MFLMKYWKKIIRDKFNDLFHLKTVNNIVRFILKKKECKINNLKN